MKNMKMAVKGMHCASCSSRIENALSSLNVISKVSVNLATETMDLEWDENVVDINTIAERVKNLGFELIIPDESDDVTLELTITGMHCASCSSRIEKVVGELEGIISVNVNLTTNMGRVVYHKDQVSARSIKEAIKNLNFKMSFGF